MAKLKDVLKLDGKAGAFSFTHGRDGFTARKAEGMNGQRIFTDKRFERTRENGAEFGQAGKSGKLFRDSLLTLTAGISDRFMTSRLQKEMVKLVKSDPTSDRGLRKASLGDPALLDGFEFNITSPLKTVVRAEYQASIDKATGSGKVMLSAHDPRKLISVPEGATHYLLLAGITAVDFDEEVSFQTISISEPRDVKNDEAAAEELSVVLQEPNADLPVFLVFGIEFIQVVNGKKYSLNNTGFNALKIVAAG
jgi:hypothetical protein